MRFEVGNIVRISKHSEYFKAVGFETDDPCDGTEGVITRLCSDIRVEWDNGTENDYNERDLRLVRRS